MHRFQSSESWVTVVKDDCDISEQYDFPKRKALFSFNRNNFVTLFTISTELTSQCVSVLGVKKLGGTHITILPMSPSRLSNSKLFMNTITAKIAKNVKEHTQSTGPR